MSGQQTAQADAAAPAAPATLFRVERGDPSAEELAALTCIIAALASGGSGADGPAVARRGGSGWGSRWRALLPRMPLGGGWGGR